MMKFDISLLLAYVDPGTGALIFQVLVAGVVAGLAFFTNLFQSVGRGFKWVFARVGLRRVEPAPPQPNPQP
jgi:hypothetical protein